MAVRSEGGHSCSSWSLRRLWQENTADRRQKGRWHSSRPTLSHLWEKVQRSRANGIGEGQMSGPLFALGQIVATPGALAAIEASGDDPLALLSRHVSGDWGDLDEHDRRENELGLREGFRLLSA
jgi:hypothetical protein